MPTAEDHRHCRVCGKTIDADEQFCSEACATKRAQTLQRGRTYQMLMYAAILVLVLLLVSELVR